MTIRVRSASVGCRTSGPATLKSATLGESYQVRLGGAGGARTHDRRIMRTTAPCTMRASCTDDTENGTDGTHRAGTIWRVGPRTGPRPTTATATQRYHAPSELRHPERLTMAARPAVCAHRTGPSAALWPARASARTTAMPMCGCRPRRICRDSARCMDAGMTDPLRIRTGQWRVGR